MLWWLQRPTFEKKSCVKQSLRLHSQYSVSRLDYSNLEEQEGRNTPRVFLKIKYLSVSGTQLTHTIRENWNLKKMMVSLNLNYFLFLVSSMAPEQT